MEKEEESAIEASACLLSQEDTLALVEALLFACGEPLSLAQLESLSGQPEEVLQDVLALLGDRSRSRACGVELVSVGGGYQLRTKGWLAPFLRSLKADRPRRLSAAALETLSIVAYRQPIVKSDIEKIRGVDVTPTLKTLFERKLIRIVGHRPTVGQPALYATTEEFLSLFGLNSLQELPTLRDLNELESDPGEIEEGESESCPSDQA